MLQKNLLLVLLVSASTAFGQTGSRAEADEYMAEIDQYMADLESGEVKKQECEDGGVYAIHWVNSHLTAIYYEHEAEGSSESTSFIVRDGNLVYVNYTEETEYSTIQETAYYTAEGNTVFHSHEENGYDFVKEQPINVLDESYDEPYPDPVGIFDDFLEALGKDEKFPCDGF